MENVLAVGTPGGRVSGFDAIPPGSGIVRIGRRITYLEGTLYDVWRKAAMTPAFDELMAWGAACGIADIAGEVSTLEGHGLVVRAGPEGCDSVGALAVRLIGDCLGNGPTPSARFVFVGLGNTRLAVDPFTYEILLRSDGVSPISSTCARLDQAARGRNHKPCLQVLADSLPVLVSHRVVRLDEAVA